MPEVAISTEDIVITASGTTILFTDVKLEYMLEYLIAPLSISLPLLIQSLLMNITVFDCNRHIREHYDAFRSGHLVDLQRFFSNCYIYRPLFVSQPKFER